MSETIATPTNENPSNTSVTTDTAVDTGNQNANTTTPPAGSETLLGGEAKTPAELLVEEKPIEYLDFTMPEGFELNGDDAKVLKEIGQQFKMPQDQVQKLVDLGVQMQQRQVAQQQQTIQTWIDSTRSDPEYGGDKLQENLLTAQRAFSLPRGDKISKILLKSGLGNHPDVIGFMTEVGKLLEPDNIINGKGTNTSSMTPASVWYDKS